MASPPNHSNKRSKLMVIGHKCTRSTCLVLFSIPLRMYTYYQCWLSQIYRSTSHLSLGGSTTNAQWKHVLLFVPFSYQALTWPNAPLFLYVFCSFPHYPSIHIDREGFSGITMDYCIRSVGLWRCLTSIHLPESILIWLTSSSPFNSL